MPLSNIGIQKKGSGEYRHCKHGHEFRPENTYQYGSKTLCRLCTIVATRKNYLHKERTKPTHCPKGHIYDTANTGYNTTKHSIYCRQCHRIRERVRRYKKALRKKVKPT